MQEIILSKKYIKNCLGFWNSFHRRNSILETTVDIGRECSTILDTYDLPWNFDQVARVYN